MEQLASFALYMLTITSITFILALSLDLQVGHCGIINFGQVMFLAVGAYATALAIAGGVGAPAAVLISVAVCTLLGVAMSLSVRNMSGTYWGILSLAMAEIIRIIALNEQWLTGGANGISVLASTPHLTWIVVGSAVAVFLIVRLILASPFGRVIHVIREGDRLPQALGKNVLGFKMITMALGGAIGGLAGAYYALMQRYMSPDDVKPIETFIIWAMIVVGGRGNLWGIVLGTIVIQTF
jgi:branched-chain amino acid transport system permease protein